MKLPPQHGQRLAKWEKRKWPLAGAGASLPVTAAAGGEGRSAALGDKDRQVGSWV